MLVIALIASTLYLLSVNVLIRLLPRLVSSTIIFGGSLLGAVLGLMIYSPPLSLQLLMTGVGTIFWAPARERAASFLRFTCGVMLVAYAGYGVVLVRSARENERLRGIYPYVSIESRLPELNPNSEVVSLSEAATERLLDLEATRYGPYSSRSRRLRDLHESSVAEFINAPGFGIGRLMYVNPTKENLAIEDEPSPLQPGSRFTSIWSPGDSVPVTGDGDTPLGNLLDESIRGFINLGQSGYAKDRRHVAGFQSHGFRDFPWSAPSLKIQTLELVSLVLHDEPEVYVSDRLPKMDELHDMPTRPLDRFERAGLYQLRKGDDLFASHTEEGTRMIGAVRSINQCVTCHGGKRGDLLGAFSYSLRSDAP